MMTCRLDQFTREQIGRRFDARAESSQRIATGYNRLLQTSHEGGVQPKEYLAIYAADRIRNLSAVWMGATVGCAQCHDHKYDPYTHRRTSIRWLPFLPTSTNSNISSRNQLIAHQATSRDRRAEPLAAKTARPTSNAESASWSGHAASDVADPQRWSDMRNPRSRERLFDPTRQSDGRW